MMQFVNSARGRERKTDMKKRMDWSFYRYVLALALPIMLQNGIMNLVNLLDNIMVGRVGTEQMSGVSIVNQLLFVYNLSLFGATAGPGIFISQFHGGGNREAEQQTFRYKLVACLTMFVAGVLVLSSCSEPLIQAWLHDGGEGDLQLTMQSAREYLGVMLFGMLPLAITYAYSSTLRETGETKVPMKASILAVCINLVLNYVLIFGKFGAPALGVRGAAIATVTSRMVECTVVAVWTHTHSARCTYIRGAFRHFRIRPQLALEIFVKSMPLVINEIAWSLSKTMLSRCYAQNGLEVVASFNIASAVNDFASVTFGAFGTASAILIGNLLGSGKTEEARKAAPKVLLFGALFSAAVGVLQVSLSGVFPMLYNTTDAIRDLAAHFILCYGIFQPMYSIAVTEYYILRSGGTVWITLLFDSVFEWLAPVPVAALLVFFTDLPITTVYICVLLAQSTKAILGTVLVRKGTWVRNLAEKNG